MKARKYYAFLAVGVVLIALATVFPTKKASAHGDESHFVVASSMLSGLGTGTVFPFIDTTPQTISQAHVAITDATTNCSPGAAPPTNVKVLVGQAGVSLVPVMDASTNTGISTSLDNASFT
jgi:fucose permease